MDLLYILGSGSFEGDVELRYSLRSIAANCKGYDRIFLCGCCPGWIAKPGADPRHPLVYLPCDDPYDCTHKNMMHKILHACHNSDISDDFVMQGDDHFYVKPYDFGKIQPYEKGDLPTCFKQNEIAPNYRTSLMDTREWLIRNGLPHRNGSQHCGQPFRKSLLLEHEKDLFEPAFKFPYGLESSSIMAALLVYEGIYTYTYRHDCKFSHFDGETGLLERIGEDFCFSIYNRAFDFGLKKILQKWWPTASPWERTNGTN